MAEPAPERSKRRRRWPVFVILFLVALIAVGFFTREHLAAWAATKALEMKYGISSRLDIDHFDSHQAQIASVSLGGGGEIKASDINLQFEPIAMTVQRIEIGRVEVHAHYDGHELTLGELDPMLRTLTAGGDGGGQGPLPSIIIHKIVLTLDTPLGTLSGDGMATIDQGVIYSQFALTEPYKRSAVRVDLNAALSDQSPQPKGKVTVDLAADSALWTMLGLPQPAGRNDAIHRTAEGAARRSHVEWYPHRHRRPVPGPPIGASAAPTFPGRRSRRRWQIEGNGRAVLSARRLEIPTFNVEGNRRLVAGSRFAAAGFEPRQSRTGAPLRCRPRVDVKAQTKSASLGMVQLKSPAFDLGLQIQYADDRLEVRPSRDGTIKFAQAAIGPSIKLTKPATFTIKEGRRNPLQPAISSDRGQSIAASAAIGVTTLELTTPWLAAPLQLAVPNGVLGFTGRAGRTSAIQSRPQEWDRHGEPAADGGKERQRLA